MAATTTTVDVPANSRTTLPMHAIDGLANARYGVLVESIGTAPLAQLVVERAMYWNAGGDIWAAGTNLLATPVPDPAIVVGSHSRRRSRRSAGVPVDSSPEPGAPMRPVPRLLLAATALPFAPASPRLEPRVQAETAPAPGRWRQGRDALEIQ